MVLWRNNIYFNLPLISSLSFIVLINKIILTSQACIANENNCYKCNPQSKLCAICQNREIYIPDEKGGCKGILKCFSGKNYCNKCDLNGKLCEKCERGYYPDENGGCTYTENCKISNKGECIECKQNFLKIGKKGEWEICKYYLNEDFNHCKKINYEKGYCDICEDSYFLTSENRCIQIDNCQESIFGICIKCKYGYYYNKRDDICEQKTYDFRFCIQSLDNKTCEICDYNNYLDEDGICIPTNYCSKSINLTCVKCISGYFLTGNLVCTNTDNCSNGDKEIGICNICKKNYYLDTKDYICKSNIEYNEFIYCLFAEEGKCKQCESGYYLGEDFRCSSSKNCSESQNGICISCSKDYYLDLDNMCSDVEHCIHQSNDYYNTCLECKDGYFFSKKYKKCYEYNSTFNNCKYSCIQLDQCCKCKDNYYLRNNDSLCFSNLESGPFYKCAESSYEGDYCWECSEPYFLGAEDHLCNLVDNCSIIENEFRCKKCMDYNCLNVKNGICYENYKIINETNKKYFACNRTNDEGTACDECLYGFKVGDQGLCVNMDNCTERENGNGKCLKCDKEFCANDDFGCINNYYPNCVKCNNFTDFEWCTECEDGYIVNSFGICEIKKNDTESIHN